MLEVTLLITAALAVAVAGAMSMIAKQSTKKIDPLFDQIDTELKETNSSTAARLDRLDYFFKMTRESDEILKQHLAQLQEYVDGMRVELERTNRITVKRLKSLELSLKRYANQGSQIDEMLKESLERWAVAHDRIRHMEADVHHIKSSYDVLAEKQDDIAESYRDLEGSPSG